MTIVIIVVVSADLAVVLEKQLTIVVIFVAVVVLEKRSTIVVIAVAVFAAVVLEKRLTIVAVVFVVLETDTLGLIRSYLVISIFIFICTTTNTLQE